MHLESCQSCQIWVKQLWNDAPLAQVLRRGTPAHADGANRKERRLIGLDERQDAEQHVHDVELAVEARRVGASHNEGVRSLVVEAFSEPDVLKRADRSRNLAPKPQQARAMGRTQVRPRHDNKSFVLLRRGWGRGKTRRRWKCGRRSEKAVYACFWAGRWLPRHDVLERSSGLDKVRVRPRAPVAVRRFGSVPQTIPRPIGIEGTCRTTSEGFESNAAFRKTGVTTTGAAA